VIITVRTQQNLGRIIALLLAAVTLAACGGLSFKGALIEPPTPAPDFTLTDHQGQPWRLSDQSGKITLLFFGFTNCPDVCPTALADIAAARKQLGADAERVQAALISVDPERDTPAVLGRYVARFDPTFVGLYGSQAELEPILRSYGVYAAKRELPNSALGYTMDHTGSIYVIDQQGRWRAMLDHGTPVQDIANDLLYLLRTNGG
jgi:protein SCO1